MSDSITTRKTYKYRLYRCDRKDRKLRQMFFVAAAVWNHFIALQRRFYRLTGKYISLHTMNIHVLKLRKTQRFALWRDLHSQVCQDVCWRINKAYYSSKMRMPGKQGSRAIASTLFCRSQAVFMRRSGKTCLAPTPSARVLNPYEPIFGFNAIALNKGLKGLSDIDGTFAYQTLRAEATQLSLAAGSRLKSAQTRRATRGAAPHSGRAQMTQGAALV